MVNNRVEAVQVDCWCCRWWIDHAEMTTQSKCALTWFDVPWPTRFAWVDVTCTSSRSLLWCRDMQINKLAFQEANLLFDIASNEVLSRELGFTWNATCLQTLLPRSSATNPDNQHFKVVFNTTTSRRMSAGRPFCFPQDGGPTFRYIISSSALLAPSTDAPPSTTLSFAFELSQQAMCAFSNKRK